MIHLYDYQSDLINLVRSELSSGKKHICIQSPTGSGKTVIFSHIVKEMEKRGKRALIITDRVELLFETGGTLQQFSLNPFKILAGQMVEPPMTHQVYIAMSQTLRLRIGKWNRFFKSFDVVILDECFIAGTKVDGINIEDIKRGDFVSSYNHKNGKIEKKKVLNTFKNEIKNDLLLISLSCGHIVCTQKHPIFVIDKGYVNAENLKEDDRIILHNLWTFDEKRSIQVKQLVRQEKKIFKNWIDFLLNKMQKYIFCSISFNKDEKKQSYDERGKCIENERNIEKNRTQTPSSRWKWTRIDRTAKNTFEFTWGGLVSRISYTYWRKLYASSLQNRHSKSNKENCNRSRWIFSLFNNCKKKRFEERSTISIERVQSISIYKQSNIRKSNINSKFNFVYNIEVEDNNNYFANGILVHNCHKQEFNPYFENDVFNGAIILGFSATPMRMGKQRQLAEDYEVLIEGLQVPELIKRGRLVPDKYFGIVGANVKGVKLNSFGDYQESGMYERFNRRELYAGVVENWRRNTPNTATLCFCVNIQHTINTCKAFNEAGIPAKFLVSDVAIPIMGKGESAKVKYDIKMAEYENFREAYRIYSGDRNVVLSDWKKRKYDVLINTGILTTGFNRKDIETIIVNRATTSIPLWLQMLGRGSRTYPGKTHFNILDFGNNAAELGYYNQQRQWSLYHDQSKSTGGAPPVKECGTMGQKRIADKLNNPGCGCYVFASARICPFCGYIFEQEKELKFAELVQINYSEPLPIERNYFDELEREAESRGYKFGWVLNQIIAKQGEQGLINYAKSRNYQSGWVWQTKRRYAAQIEAYEKKHLLKNIN